MLRPKKQPSKKSSPRIFTEEDELVILEAVLEIQEDCPIIPAKAATVIFNGIQNKITAQVNKTQLGEKMRKLRDKYCKEEMMTDAEFNPHQQKLSILCKKIWGIKKSNPVKQKKMLKDDDDDMRNAKEDDDFVKNYPSLMKEVSSNSFVSIDTLRYLDDSMLQKLNERWRKQHFMELQHFLKRMDFKVELVKLVIDAHTSSSKGKDDVDDEEAIAVDDADDELVGDADDENKQSEDVEEAEDVDDDEEAEVAVEVESDDE